MRALTRVDDTRLASAIATNEVDIGVLWEACIVHEFDRRGTVDGIAAWLDANGRDRRILDCACGSGFPAIDLWLRGYNIEASDGSTKMLEHFRRHAKLMGADISPKLCAWENLTEEFGRESFAVVMCRGGGSYLYAGTWDDNADPDRSVLYRVFGQFWHCLRPGGQLYVDVTRSEVIARQHPHWSGVRLAVAGHEVVVDELITIDRDSKTRTWYARMLIDDRQYEFERRSHLVTHEELVETLHSVGFRNITPSQIEGEPYDVFTATRPIR